MILCCGDALIDMMPRQTADGEPAFAPHKGGALLNTAIALGRLGVPVEFFSGLSSDFFGDILRRALDESGVGTRYAKRANRPTTLAFVRLNDGQAQYIFYDENTASRMLTERDLPQLEPEVSALLFGAVSLVGEPCGSAYEALMRREHGRRVVMLDPNIRPDFIPDKARHKARLRRMLAMSDIVKVSDDDLDWFREEDGDDPVAGWLAMGVKLILVTHGGDGAMGYTIRDAVNVAAIPAKVVDTVGAGDTFNAGLLASLHQSGLLSKPALAEIGADDIRAALRLGVKAAAVTVSRAGVDPPWRQELD